MFPRGTIYDSRSPKSFGGVNIKAPLVIRLSYFVIRGLGAGLFGFAIISLIFTYGPPLAEELSYRINGPQKAIITNKFASLLDNSRAQEISRVQKEATSYGVDSYFSVVIPKINAKSKIIANVDAGNEKDYADALSRGVAHARGTYFPGMGNNIFLFSHSTNSSVNVSRYNAIFYLLRKLTVGDQIIIFFADKKYVYQVEKKVIAKPSDTSWITGKSDGEQLVLQTCDPPGTTWNRLLIIAKPI